MATETKQSTIPWSTDFDRSLGTARELHKAVLVDFTAAPM
jgi:hypothetical protein